MGALLWGCEGVRHLEAGEQLLRNDPTFEGNRTLSDDVLAEGVLTKANRRLVVPKLYLHLYALGRTLEQDSSFAKRLYRRADKSRYYEKTFVHWLVDVVGEPPQVVDSTQLETDAGNLESIYFGEGFLNASVTPVVNTPKRDPKKADVVYRIDEGPAYVLRELRYYYRDTTSTLQGAELVDSLGYTPKRARQDSTILRLIEENGDASLLVPGDRFNEAKLTQERVRLSNFMKDQGYYTFGPDQVFYVVDTLPKINLSEALLRTDTLAAANPRQDPDIGRVDTSVVATGLEDAQRLLREEALADKRDRKMGRRAENRVVAQGGGTHAFDLEVIVPDTARVYYIDSVFVTLRRAGEVDTRQAVRFNLLNPAAALAYGVSQKGLKPDYDLNFALKPDLAQSLNLSVIAKRIRQRPGIRYSRHEAQLTQNQLQGLGLFRNAVINFRPVPGTNKLHTYIDAVLLRNYTASVGAEVFVSDDRQLVSNLPGLGATARFGVQNLFGRAEQLTVATNGFVTRFSPGDGAPPEFFFQTTTRVSLNIPRFLFLERNPDRDLLKYRPSTSFSLTYQQEQRNIFERTNLSAAWQYQWYNLPNSLRAQSTLTPLNVTWVRTLEQAGFDSTIASISDTSLRALVLRDFEPRLATKSSYSFSYSRDYGEPRDRNTWFFRGNVEVGGNLPFLLDVITGSDGSTTDNQLGAEFQYAQFARLSLEYKYFIPTGARTEAVFRAFLGGARAFNTAPVVPFENRFFTGGPSTVRGWLSGTLGPGTWRSDSVRISNLIAPGGEIIFELNAEYRAKLSDLVAVAFFADAGNVWFTSTRFFEDERGALRSENLQLGVSAGFGLRFDLSFFVFRFDIGQQVYAPDVQRLIVKDFRSLGAGRAQFNIGIGYPF